MRKKEQTAHCIKESYDKPLQQAPVFPEGLGVSTIIDFSGTGGQSLFADQFR